MSDLKFPFDHDNTTTNSVFETLVISTCIFEKVHAGDEVALKQK